jgi:hypothetical protein
MRKEELKYAKNVWIGEILVKNRNVWEDAPVEAIGIITGLGYLMWSAFLGSTVLFAPIHTITHWNNLLVDCKPSTYHPFDPYYRETPKICESVPLYREDWYQLLSFLLMSTAITEVIVFSFSISRFLNRNIGFYSKTLHELRIEEERAIKRKEIQRVEYEHKMLAKKRRSKK